MPEEKKVLVGVLAIIRERTDKGGMLKFECFTPAIIKGKQFFFGDDFPEGWDSNAAQVKRILAGASRSGCLPSLWFNPPDSPLEAAGEPGIYLAMVYPVYFPPDLARVFRLTQDAQEALAGGFNVGPRLARFFDCGLPLPIAALFNALVGETVRIMSTVPQMVRVGQSELEAIEAMSK